MTLTQADADRLIAMIKETAEKYFAFPNEHKRLSFDVIGTKMTDEFTINISRKGLNSDNCTCQGRVKKDNQILLRVDVGPTLRHTNPDALGGDKLIGDHIHLYREGYDMNYAVSVDINDASFVTTCLMFFSKFGVTDPPEIHDQTEFNLCG